VDGTKRFDSKLYLSLVGAYGWDEMSTSRFVTVAGTDHLTAKFLTNNYGGRIEGGYRFDLDRLGMTPYAALQGEAFNVPAYSEVAVSGSSVFALSYSARSASMERAELGVNLDRDFESDGDTIVHLFERTAWAHDNSSAQDGHPTFLSLPDSGFTVHGAVPAEDSALVSVGAQARTSEHLSVAARMDGLIAPRTNAYFGTATLNYTW